MNKCAIISAFLGEVKPLIEGWSPVVLKTGQAAWRGRIGATECVAVSGGMGPDAAARACAVAMSILNGPDGLRGLDALVSLGWAGALSCGVSPARAYAVAEVIDADTEECFSTTFPRLAASPIKLLSLDHVALAQEKRQLAERHGAALVDMEAAAVARIAIANGIGFCCFKSVSDGYNEVLPDFSKYGDAHGQIRIPALLAHTACRPRYWPAMARLGKNTKTGAAALAAALRDFLEQYADNVSH